ncbi:MAG: transposase [Gallionella sp.]|jgi:transposase-like protein
MDYSPSIRRRRRQHTPEFKQGLVAQCLPGVSTSAVALAHGINANLLRRWIKQFPGVQPSHAITAPAKLVPVKVDLPVEAPVSDAIEISIQKNSARISIHWPGTQAQACALWLAECLK